ncbi:hypothetical protein M0R45_010414 [Rubus argutus]|uniref:Uncharacterized protein n=1 Tax=Rubus argutus TaxID=59490 RepID=A0AAW1Y6Z1_RUBAR
MSSLITNSKPNEEDKDEAAEQPWSTFKPKKGSMVPKKRRSVKNMMVDQIFQLCFGSGKPQEDDAETSNSKIGRAAATAFTLMSNMHVIVYAWFGILSGCEIAKQNQNSNVHGTDLPLGSHIHLIFATCHKQAQGSLDRSNQGGCKRRADGYYILPSKGAL